MPRRHGVASNEGHEMPARRTLRFTRRPEPAVVSHTSNASIFTRWRRRRCYHGPALELFGSQGGPLDEAYSSQAPTHAPIGITSEASTQSNLSLSISPYLAHASSHAFTLTFSFFLMRQVGCRVAIQGSRQNGTRPGSGVIEGRTPDGAKCDVRCESPVQRTLVSRVCVCGRLTSLVRCQVRCRRATRGWSAFGAAKLRERRGGARVGTSRGAAQV